MSPQSRSVFFQCIINRIYYNLKLVPLFFLFFISRTSFAYFYYVIESESSYATEILIEPFETCDESNDCMVKLECIISFLGVDAPDSLSSIIINWMYDGETIEIVLPTTSGISIITCFYGDYLDGDCDSIPKINFNEVDFDLWVSGPGIPEQIIDWTYAFNQDPLIRFEAEVIESKVKLEWELTHELNNDYFIIERSFDGIEWNMLDSIKSLGNYTDDIVYQLMDNEPNYGISYYRLKRVDNNGISICMETISVLMEIEYRKMLVYPNPTSNGFTVIGNKIKGGKVILVDLLNRTVIEFVAESDNSVFVPTDGLLMGSYILMIEKNGRLMQELVVVH
ncbi:MAG: hypothetical protein ACI8ZM_005157 [Crocinitomix sp.]|jgi:hypothetical protein